MGWLQKCKVGLREVYKWLTGSVQLGYGFVRLGWGFVPEVYGLDPECTVSIQMTLQLIFLLLVITTYYIKHITEVCSFIWE